MRFEDRFVRVWAAAGAAAVLSLAGIAAEGQDTRQVTEPKIPAACVRLNAQLVAVGDKVAEADEQKLDTERIQAALDKCKPGMAVELKVDGKKNAFLTGPLELRTGVTLLVDKGVTLFGSRDPAMYEFGATQTDPVAGGAVRDESGGGDWRRCGGSCALLRVLRDGVVQAADLGDECEGCGDHGRWRDRWAWVREDAG